MQLQILIVHFQICTEAFYSSHVYIRAPLLVCKILLSPRPPTWHVSTKHSLASCVLYSVQYFQNGNPFIT
jgi:hypothetical protein